ncbi:uncharacterized protein LOC116264624 isoform X2 [Nymphaea colorata]|uniref:uncharacterized protein LOC116264624 isoform X2 n=1 Tax=Nymphaea colorata TaxID=210225 RepID=UPI00129D7963|nr:uncharacterized protein LOC116264624 isoform X2 [Nymphaea colorata]
MCQGGHQPCLYCHPHGYIRMVQHLIEVCLILRMGMDDCVEALAQHAGIQPLVTLTVWRELMKENREFFQAYSPATSENSPANKPLQCSFGTRTRR